MSTFIPYTCAELLDEISGMNLLNLSWPKYNEEFTLDDNITIIIQINFLHNFIIIFGNILDWIIITP